VASVSHLGPIHLGLDVHKDTISAAILAPDRDGPDVERIPHDEPSVRRLVGRLVSAYTFTCRLAYGLTCRSSCGVNIPVRLS
jgi:hypothetical protein